ncbi:hypothetical protein, partial [Rhodovulum adriaticum]|uniref:Uncharacterized protein n=1 Tax=Rhodovulum adriaticum TaxID=35804 RepID=A0A4V2SKH0_RHOAD
MAQLFRRHPAALKRTLEIAARCSFCLSELSYEYPDELTARTGVIRSRIPITSGHTFRFDPVTDSGVSDHPWNRP